MQALDALNERAREIFRQIVESYLTTGEPVGSRNLARILPMALSPASIRNVMADLEHSGLIFAPHTSAGRLPTELGLRFFVDAMLEVGDVGQEEQARIEAQMRAAASGHTFDSALAEASTMLSGISRGAGVVLTTKANVHLKHIEFVRLDPARALVVLVSDDGSVENRLVDLPPGLPAGALQEATNFLNARLQGRTLGTLRAEIEAGRKAMKRELDALTERLVDAALPRPWVRARRGSSSCAARRTCSTTCAPSRISSGSACCSTIWRPRRTSSTSWPAPRAAKACGSSSAPRTSCSRSRAPP